MENNILETIKNANKNIENLFHEKVYQTTFQNFGFIKKET